MTHSPYTATALMNSFMRWFEIGTARNSNLKNFTLIGYNTEGEINDVDEDVVLGVLWFH